MTGRIVLASLLAAVGLIGCQQTIPKEALQLTQESLEQRQAQTRRFDTADEAVLLSASAAVLQDLGFNLDESETALGVIVASKDRDATEAGQVAGAIFMAVLFGASMPIDTVQKIRASLVTRTHGERADSTAVRITFQRIIWNNRGQISKTEALTEPELYQEFFEKLSKSVFLEAHQI
ncbi:MAG: hypothetical protein ACE5GS_06610 [Kiloniellaceae bacterium]